MSDQSPASVACTPLTGTPAEIGAAWGCINREAIHQDLELQYLAPAREAGLTRRHLQAQAETFVRIALDLAPHWLDENAAIAAAAGVDSGLYTAFVANVYRRRHDLSKGWSMAVDSPCLRTGVCLCIAENEG